VLVKRARVFPVPETGGKGEVRAVIHLPVGDSNKAFCFFDNA
jgi:hypothetical protein